MISKLKKHFDIEKLKVKKLINYIFALYLWHLYPAIHDTTDVNHGIYPLTIS